MTITEERDQDPSYSTPEDRQRSSYAAFPLQVLNPNEATVRKCERILAAFLDHPNFFTDYLHACEDRCGICEQCSNMKTRVAETLTDPKARCWEVWRLDEDALPVDLVGILRMSRIDPGQDALGHYFFFDGRLSDKTALLQRWIEWAFQDHPDEGWLGLHRATIEVPEYAFALARHAMKRLGFGGPYEYEMDGRTVEVEGVRREAKTRDGRHFDMLILGLTEDDLDGGSR